MDLIFQTFQISYKIYMNVKNEKFEGWDLNVKMVDVDSELLIELDRPILFER